MCVPLRNLTQRCSLDLITSVIRYYNIKEEASIQCYVRTAYEQVYATGAAGGLCIRTVTPIEERKIEKECLAIVFACDKFEQYIIGKHSVKVETDHKPMVSIFKNHGCKPPKDSNVCYYVFRSSASSN